MTFFPFDEWDTELGNIYISIHLWAEEVLGKIQVLLVFCRSHVLSKTRTTTRMWFVISNGRKKMGAEGGWKARFGKCDEQAAFVVPADEFENWFLCRTTDLTLHQQPEFVDVRLFKAWSYKRRTREGQEGSRSSLNLKFYKRMALPTSLKYFRG